MLQVNYDRRKNYDNGLIEIKTFMLQSRLCDYSYAYILVKGIITIVGTGAGNVQLNQEDIQVAFKDCSPFINSIINIHETKNMRLKIE